LRGTRRLRPDGLPFGASRCSRRLATTRAPEKRAAQLQRAAAQRGRRAAALPELRAPRLVGGDGLVSSSAARISGSRRGELRALGGVLVRGAHGARLSAVPRCPGSAGAPGAGARSGGVSIEIEIWRCRPPRSALLRAVAAPLASDASRSRTARSSPASSARADGWRGGRDITATAVGAPGCARAAI
jgi:hypothetical protein